MACNVVVFNRSVVCSRGVGGMKSFCYQQRSRWCALPNQPGVPVNHGIPVIDPWSDTPMPLMAAPNEQAVGPHNCQ
jgi:hypothetical protein